MSCHPFTVECATADEPEDDDLLDCEMCGMDEYRCICIYSDYHEHDIGGEA